MSPIDRISSDQLRTARSEYATNGYCILRNVVSTERLESLHSSLVQEFDRASSSGGLFSGGGQLSGHLNCFPGEGARFVYDTLEQRGVMDLVRELHPRVLRMPNVGCNFNLPGSHAQHWHTDRPFTDDFIIANVAVVDSNLENGATAVIPGTHNQFYKYTRFVLKRIGRKGVRVPLHRGDVLLRSSNLWHRGMTNHTRVPRPMLAFTWEDGGNHAADPFSAEGGAIRFLPNWFKLTPAGRVREWLFVRVPVTYAALRLARSVVDSSY